VRDVLIDVVIHTGESASEHMRRVVDEVRRANVHVPLTVEVSDMNEDFDRAAQLDVHETPTVVVSLDGIELGRLTGVKSRRSLLQIVLPALYDEDRALDELRRQLDSPGERFPRRSRRRTGMVSEQRRRQLLGRADLFATLTSRQLKELAAVCTEVVFEAGSTVVTAGQPGEELFVVADGDLEVSAGRGHSARLGPGDTFGEMALLDGLPRSATVSAVTDATLIGIDRTTFRELLTSSPSIALALLGVMSRRVRRSEASLDA
jgi:CRP/FNR family transcriptional regulator, cyclic AMP receptor protein